jgi:hypothetical protein
VAYSDRWGITIQKQADGVYTVSRSGRSLTVTIAQVYANEAINEGAALFAAIQALDPDFSDTWRTRYQYAVARWKVAGYTATRQGTTGSIRQALTAKLTYWESEVTRLQALLGSDA